MSEENETIRPDGTIADKVEETAAEIVNDNDKENETENNGTGTDAPTPAGNIGAADRINVYRVSVLWLTLIAVAARLVALFTSYDRGIGYFNQNNIFPYLSDAMIAIVGILAISAVFFFKNAKDLTASPKFTGGAEFFGALYAGFIFIADAAFMIYNFVGDCTSGEIRIIIDRFKNIKYYNSPADTTARILTVIGVIAFVCSVLAAVYFLRGGGNDKKGQAVLVCFAIIRGVCGLAKVYFNMEVAMNNPMKLLCEVALMSVMLYFLTEERFNIGGFRAKPNLFIGASLAAFLFGTVAGLTAVIGFLTGAVPYADCCVESVLTLVCGLYAFIRLSAYERIVRFPKPETVTETDETSGTDENVTDTQTED